MEGRMMICPNCINGLCQFTGVPCHKVDTVLAACFDWSKEISKQKQEIEK